MREPLPHHRPVLLPGTVSAPPVTMVQAALGAVLVASAGRSKTLGTPFPATQRAAVGVAAIAGAADEEPPLAPAAGAHAEDSHSGPG